MSALLFFNKLWQDLESLGFIINPCDPYGANKINRYQMIVVWHVYELKISHKHPWRVTKMALWLSKIYGDIKVHCGKKTVYLGMDLDCSQQGQVKVSMVPYTITIITNFLEEINGVLNTLAADYFFEVRPSSNAKKLPD